MKRINLKNIFSRRAKTENLESAAAWPVTFVRDWKVMVLCFAFGLAALSFFAWQIYLSDRIAAGYLSTEVPFTSTSVRTVDMKKLQAGLLILDTKQTDYLKLKATQPKIIDPSR